MFFSKPKPNNIAIGDRTIDMNRFLRAKIRNLIGPKVVDVFLKDSSAPMTFAGAEADMVLELLPRRCEAAATQKRR